MVVAIYNDIEHKKIVAEHNFKSFTPNAVNVFGPS